VERPLPRKRDWASLDAGRGNSRIYSLLVPAVLTRIGGGSQNVTRLKIRLIWPNPAEVSSGMADNDQKGTPMRHRVGIRKMGWAGMCLAFASSILVLAPPTSAVAQDSDPVHQDDYRHFAVFLTGDELRDGGDRSGWGMARLDLDPAKEAACYDLTWHGLDGAVTAFHLHAAPRGHDGPHWIDFFNDQHFDGKRHGTSGCVHVPRGKILDVINEPSDYYFAVHSTAHKGGAIRGQLF
jgi:CHRD domain